MKRTAVIAAIVVLIIIVVAVAAVALLNKPASTSQQSPSGSGSSPTNTTSVSIQNFAFDPTPLTVSVGTTVTWTNNQDVTHTVTSDPGSSESFESGNLAPGATFSHTFNTAGTINYHCSIHTYMHGQVIVTTAGSSNPTPSGSNTSNPSPVPGY